jgi:glycerol-3-phosphate dehydrogenase (NAD(P)+)
VSRRGVSAAPPARVAVLGLTSWGLGLTVALARTGARVLLLARDASEAAKIASCRTHTRLPGASLPPNVDVQTADRAVLPELRALILAVPAQRMRENIRAVAPRLQKGIALISASKGLEEATRLRMTEVIAQEAGDECPVAALSGPNLAPEIVAGLPAASVLACADTAEAAALQALLATPRLRLYTSHDVVGAEIGGALKNVIALSAGLSEGLGYGDNAKAALITRGLAEIVRLGVAMRADPLTFAGLSGLGDLIATCASPLSRNHRAGRLLAQGFSRGEVEETIGEVVEGIGTTAAAHALSCEHGVTMPITKQLYRVLYEGMTPREAAETLMLRDLTGEPPI